MPAANGSRQMREIHLPTNARVSSDLVPDIRLTRGRTVWVLKAMGVSVGVTTPGRVHLPFNLSTLAISLVEHAGTAPNIRRGPH